MKRMPFPVGSLVVNSGRLRGQGYIWRVEGYRPRWAGDRWDESKQNVLCKNLGPLHGKPQLPLHIAAQAIKPPAIAARL